MFIDVYLFNKQKEIMTTLNDIKLAVSEGKSIKVNNLNFYQGWQDASSKENRKKIYYMQDEYNSSKWQMFNDDKDAIKAIFQRVNYFNKKGFPKATEIK